MTDQLAEALPEAMFRAGMNAWENTHESQEDRDFRAFLGAALRVLADHLKPTPAPAGGMEMTVYGAASIRELAARVEHPAEETHR